MYCLALFLHVLVPITEDIEDGAPGDSLVAHQDDYEVSSSYVLHIFMLSSVGEEYMLSICQAIVYVHTHLQYNSVIL